MAGALTKPRTPGSLKEAEALLVQACGGQKAAAELVRVSRSQLGRYTDDSDENACCHMPVDITLALERICGEAFVTQFLASSQARALIAINVTESEPYPVVLSKIGRETGRLFAKAAEALADGTISRRESGAVKREALALMAACAGLLRDLDGAAP